MKKSFKKIISLIVSLTFVLSVFSITTVFAFEKYNKNGSIMQKQTRLMTVYDNKVQQIEKNEQELDVNEVKTLIDFAGAEYSLIECLPIGYMIYHNESGNFVESSPSSVSPYLGLENNLYYGGPTEYYQLVGNTYIHTVLNETISTDIDKEIMESASIFLTDKLNETQDSEILNFVENNIVTKVYAPIASYAINSGFSDAKINWFKGLTSCGYYEVGDGCCGYVALNIIYAYFDKFIDDKYMDDKYWVENSSKSALQDGETSFSKYLYDLDPKQGTTSSHIHSVSKQYLVKKSITNIKHTSKFAGFFNDSTIKNLLNSQYPVILFGNYPNPTGYTGTAKKGGHAVVAYDYIKGFMKTDYVVHYGWPGYTEVTITNAIGSIYAMEA